MRKRGGARKMRLGNRGRKGLSAAERRQTLRSVMAARQLQEAIRQHAYLAVPLRVPAKKKDLVLGYPDEHEAMTSFVDSLAMYVTNGKWQAAYPLTIDRLAFSVDLTSRSETHAERLVQAGWTGDRESPYRIDEVFVEDAEVNEQNLRYKRQFSLIVTGIAELDYEQRVASNLPRADEAVRGYLTLPDVFVIFATGVGVKTIHLFSMWKPSSQLLAQLGEHYIKISWKPLSVIPKAASAKIQYVHLWDGTRKQGKQFLKDVWGRS